MSLEDLGFDKMMETRQLYAQGYISRKKALDALFGIEEPTSLDDLADMMVEQGLLEQRHATEKRPTWVEEEAPSITYALSPAEYAAFRI